MPQPIRESCIESENDERALERFPLERKRSNDEKTRQIKKLERVLIAKVYQLLRNSL